MDKNYWIERSKELLELRDKVLKLGFSMKIDIDQKKKYPIQLTIKRLSQRLLKPKLDSFIGF